MVLPQAKAFSGEAATSQRQENASNQESVKLGI
jgi:hypothetical protein